jgi:peptidoglycan/LPS O-acetylase OafA/YrhL/glycosyltransferase involved in cell wall biosynthesis
MQANDRFHDNNFTVLRLVLALLVVLGHFKNFIGIFRPSFPFDYSGMAVYCFFVVSGYLVTSSFDRDANVGRFYLRRLFRIYPLYIAVVVAQTIILGCLAPGGPVDNWRSILGYFAANAVFANFVQHDIGSGVLTGLVDPSLNASLWTLKIEVGFYLLVPLIWGAVRRHGIGVLAILFLLSALYHVVLTHAGELRYAKQLPGQLQYFALGMAAYRFRHRLRFGRRAGLAATIALAVLATGLRIGQPPLLFPAVVAALVIIAALRTPRIPLRLDISYGVYLLHAPVIQLSLLFGLYRPGWDGLAATIAVTVLLAVMAERFVEAPGIALGRRLSAGRDAAARTPPTPHSPPPPAPPPPVPSPASGGDVTVVVLNDFCHVQGGASKVAIDEATGLASMGVPVIFIGAVGPVCVELREAPLTVHCLGQPQLLDVVRHPQVALQGLWNHRAARRLDEILRTLPPRNVVVHLHGYTKALTTSPLRAARRHGVPVVCTLHDFFAACPNGAFFDYRAGRPCARKPLSAACVLTHCDKRRYAHKLFRVARGWVQRLAGGLPEEIEHYIALSRHSAAILLPHLPKRARIYPLPNPITVPRLPPVDVSRNRPLLYIGRLDEEKGVRLLARVAAELGLPVLYVGDGPLRPEIEASSPDAMVTGWLPAEDVQARLNAARCLVFPSLWYETFGLVVAEAAARGIPAIVSDISAAAERITDGTTGWRFQSGNAQDLARCLDLAADDRRVAAAGMAAYRSFWATARSGGEHAADLLDIYRAVAAAAAGAPAA